MSVSAFPAVPDDDDPALPPALRLVTEHDHEWQLRAVEYDESLEVRRYECAHCDDVLFR